MPNDKIAEALALLEGTNPEHAIAGVAAANLFVKGGIGRRVERCGRDESHPSLRQGHWQRAPGYRIDFSKTIRLQEYAVLPRQVVDPSQG